MNEFTRGYLEASLWASTDSNGDYLDTELDISAIASGTRAVMEADCAAFEAEQAELLGRWYGECGETPARAGMDFFLTREHHGAGYWDRWAAGTVGHAIGDALTRAAHAYGSVDLYVGDDGLVYSPAAAGA